MTGPRRGRFPLWLGAAFAALAALTAWSLARGAFPVSAGDAFRALFAAITGQPSGLAPNADAVILQVRTPRVFAAIAVGAALAASGAAFQALFRNPLVSPDILGVTSGCALGAAIAVLLALPSAMLQVLAFAGGGIAVGLSIAVARLARGRDVRLTLLLAGVVVGAAFGAGLALLKALADPTSQLPAITFWLLGSFTGVTPRLLLGSLVPLVAGLLPLLLLRHRIDVLGLAEDEARSLGVPVAALRLAVIACATLVTAAAVSIAGTIAWVGLIVPHAARMLAGAAFARVLPLSVAAGGAFMLAVDTLCRTAFEGEMPPGVITAFIGAPVFVALLAANARRGR